MMRHIGGPLLAIAALSLVAACQTSPPTADLADARSAIRDKDYDRAVALLLPRAEAGDDTARVELGTLNFKGIGTPVDINAALHWYKLAADDGDAVAEEKLGEVYQSGQAGGVRDAEALAWFQRAADHGNADGEMNLGFMHDVGRGTPRDFKAAIRLYVKAGEQGQATALNNIGTVYAHGNGVAQSYAKALFWVEASLKLAAADETIQSNAKDDKSHVSAGYALQIQAAAAKWKPGKGALDSVLADAHLSIEGNALPASPVPVPPSGNGSGFIINGEGEVLTANHIVDTCAALRVRLTNGTPVAATLVVTSRKYDLAVLRPDKPLGVPLALRDKPVRQGETVVVAGYPLAYLFGTGVSVSTGIVNALAGVGTDDQFRFSAAIQSGNSGGPVFDADGAVLGADLNTIGPGDVPAGSIAQNANFAIRTTAIEEFLDANSIAYKSTPAGRLRGDVPEIARQARRSVVFVECVN